MSGSAEEVEILDMDACKDLVLSDFHTADEKQDILRKNCLAIFKIKPIDIPTARYCFSFSQYFKLKRDHHTLGFDVHHLIIMSLTRNSTEKCKSLVTKHVCNISKQQNCKLLNLSEQLLLVYKHLC